MRNEPNRCEHQRSFAATSIRAAAEAPDGYAAVIEGIGVPYDIVIPDPEGIHAGETFDRGAVVLDTAGTKIFFRHYDPIGLVSALTQSDAGAVLTAAISDTALGRDAATLARDGVVDQLSLGWNGGEYYVDDKNVRHWTKVTAKEFSLVPFGAYGTSASVTNARAKENTMKHDENNDGVLATMTRADLEPLNAALDELKRGQELLRASAGGRSPQPTKWRSIGAFVKDLAAGDQEAAEFHREYTGATTADTIMKDSFVGEFIKLVTQRRRIINKFSRDTLPPDGLSVDYYQLDTDTTKVEKQAAEGDNLAFGKLTLKKANQTISTYGGWTEMSRQAIERATVPALNVTYRALGLKYGATTEAAARAVYAAQIAANAQAAGQHAEIGATLAAATATEWLNGIIDAAEFYEANGFVIEGLDVSKDVFKQLNGLKDGTQRLMKVYGDGVNAIGELNLGNLSGNLAGVKVEMIPLAADLTATFYDSVAITTMESAGAPAQLQDENIVNLSKQFSLYGYAAEIVPFPSAIHPITFAG